MTPAALSALITDMAANKVANKHPLKTPPLGTQIEILVQTLIEVFDKRYGVKAL